MFVCFIYFLNANKYSTDTCSAVNEVSILQVNQVHSKGAFTYEVFGLFEWNSVVFSPSVWFVLAGENTVTAFSCNNHFESI